MAERYSVVELTIANGASLSEEISTGDLLVCGIVMPSAWTAASITLQAARVKGGTLNDVYDKNGTEVAITTAAGRHVVLDPTLLAGCQFLKLRSGTAATPVNQGAARTLYLVCRTP